MAKIKIEREKCKGCLLCISACPKGLICIDKKLNQRGANPVRFSRRAHKISGGIPPGAGKESLECLGCALCAIICPDCCIEVWK